MSKSIKWTLIAFVGLAVVILVAVILAPMLINFEKYKPAIEAKASQVIGRPVVLEGQIAPSVFPWIGLALSDARIENPAGFSEKVFVDIGLFEVRIKLLPLIFGNYEIKRFVVKSPHIVLEKTISGKSNLEGLGGASTPPKSAPLKLPPAQDASGKGAGELPIKALRADEFAITDGRLLILDHKAGTRHEIKDMSLVLNDLSFDRPIGLDLKAVADGHPIQLRGTAGPLGSEIGQQAIQLDLIAALIDKINVKIKGEVDNILKTPRFRLDIQIPSFSLREALAEADIALPFAPADEKVLNHIALSMKLAGQPDAVSISDGTLTLDDSKIVFKARGHTWEKPDLQLSAELDSIDLDRYLPPAADKKDSGDTGTTAPAKKSSETDYAPLRKLVLDAEIKAGRIKAKNLNMQNITVKATARNGILRLEPMGMDLYKGHLSAKSTVNVQANKPVSNVDLTLNGVQSAPLIKDLLDKEMIEGAMTAVLNLGFSGDSADAIRKTLSGNGRLQFADGAIVGIDLAGMVRNVQSAFGLAEKVSEKPRTDFSELDVPFSAANGVTRLEMAKLVSPLLRITADGTADLAEETLNLRVDPKFVATLKGQGDTKERSGVMVPIVVGGTFEKPKFKPDLKALLNQPLPDKKALKEALPPKEEVKQELEQKARDLLKGLTTKERDKE